MSNMLALLILLRLGWSVLPQSGYIHPDEFFQTVEVVAGDALNISVVKTWEFTSGYPLRSVVLPQLIFRPIFKLLDDINETTGYKLITCYRLLMAVLSLWIDWCIFKICKLLGLQSCTGNLLFASSYVTLTFQTHTFSNSFESLLFVTLILLILTCMKIDEENRRKECGKRFWSALDNMFSNFSDEGHESIEKEDTNMTEDDLDSSFNDLHKMAFDLRKRSKEPSYRISRDNVENAESVKVMHNRYEENTSSAGKGKDMNRSKASAAEGKENFSLYTYIMVLAGTVTLGVFNRPTFVIFAALPFLWWTDKCPVGDKILLRRAIVFTFTGIVLFCMFVVMDTMYFRDIPIFTLFTTDGWQKIFDNYTITLYNFINYNSMVTNLETHGRHPFYVHLLVNMPLLFGPMLIFLITNTVKELWKSAKKWKRKTDETHEKQNTTNFTLSIEDKIRTDFKEAIILFILVPVVALSIFPHQEARFLIPLLPLVVLSVPLFCDNPGKIFWTFFIILNIFLSIIFGVLHQGGIVPCLLKLQYLSRTEFIKSNLPVTVIFSHTYMPPKHLLLDRQNNLELIDLKGSDFKLVFQEIEKHRYSDPDYTISRNSMKRIFLVLPGTLISEFKSNYENLLTFKFRENFFPHLSFEDPPDTRLIDSFDTLKYLMSLHLIEVE